MPSEDRPDRIRDLFNEAIELPVSERAKFLDDACGDDENLRTELASLIEHHRPDTISEIHVGPELRPAPSLGGGRTAIFGLVGAVGLTVAALLAYNLLRDSMRERVELRLVADLDTAVTSLSEWIEARKSNVEGLAQHPDLPSHLVELVAMTRDRDVTAAEISSLPPHEDLTRLVAPFLEDAGAAAVNIISRESVIVFFSQSELVGTGAYRVNAEGARALAAVFLGKTVVPPPFFPGHNVAAEATQTGRSFLMLATPIRDVNGDVMAALAVRFDSEPAFSDQLRVGSGDTYAFNNDGLMVSRSRHETDLRRLDLFPDVDGATSVLHVVLRDPGGDLLAGFEPTSDTVTRPLTKMAAAATAGQSGVDVEGYRDARGVRVVGAWQWLSAYNIGVANELAYDDAFRALLWFRLATVGLVSALGLAVLYGFVSTLPLSRWRAAIAGGERLGPYRLQAPIGEGGMAKVYRATHVRMERPVAIKILKRDGLSADEIARFEREVQLVSRLNHANTVHVFDYGQSDDGTLFYVMELVPGITIHELVMREGGIPPERVVWILRQVASSLAEAHGVGVVHRDIKPTNIMICERSDGADVVKVLDFGLATTVEGSTSHITRRRLLGGTPVYIAPERIRDPKTVDVRSDIYSLGAVGYFLLSGREIVEGATPEQVLIKTLDGQPVPLSGVPAEIDALVMSCLAKDPDARIPTAQALHDELDRLSVAFPWTQERAHAWWSQHRDDV